MGSKPSTFIDIPKPGNPNKRRKDGTFKKKGRKTGQPTKEDQAIVARVVNDSLGEVTGAQVQALAVTLDRSVQGVRSMIRTARERFIANAERYTEIHMEAVSRGLEDGSMDGLEIAQKGSQWALEHLSAEGESIIEKAQAVDTGMKIMLGISFPDKTTGRS